MAISRYKITTDNRREKPKMAASGISPGAVATMEVNMPLRAFTNNPFTGFPLLLGSALLVLAAADRPIR